MNKFKNCNKCYIFISKICCNFRGQCEHQRLMENNVSSRTRIKENMSWKISCIKSSLVVHFFITIFGSATWIGVNGIFAELPLLIKTAPEKEKLASYLVIIIQIANVAPFTYSLIKHMNNRLSETNCILCMLVIGTAAMGLLAFFYNKTSRIIEIEYSAALFIMTFFIATVGCTSSVLFMPYLKNFREIYLVSYFIGEGLSGLVPSIISFIQGVNNNLCHSNNTENSVIFNSALPRFQPKDYFFSIFVFFLLSTVAFILLDNLPFVKKEKKSIMLDHQTISEFANNSTLSNKAKKEDASLNSTYLFITLSGICFLSNGLLPSLQPYSCLSYGNWVYHLSINFSQIANPIACVLAIWFSVTDEKIFNLLIMLISCVSVYICYLAFSSPHPPLQDSKIGKALVILSWGLISGIVSFVKLIIISILRIKSEDSLITVGVVMQAGSACGAIFSFILISCTNFLKEFDACNALQN